MKKTLILTCALAAVAQADILTLTPSIDDIVTSTTNNFRATDYTNGFVAPAVNVGSGGTWTWTTSFTLSETVTVDSIDVQFITFNGSGATQTGNRNGAYTFTISGDALESPFTSGSQAVTYIGSTTSSGATVSYAPADLSLAAGEYTLTLAVDKGTETNGYFVGIGGASISTSVPEPATATLSLLALAGLAARRRRK